MTILGIGVDVVDMKRMTDIVVNNPSFVKRVLTEKEYELFESRGNKRRVEFLAGRFACKEAFSKAWGTGIGKVDFKDIEILSEESGKPYVSRSPFEGNVQVSISHSDIVGIAYIVLEKTKND